MNKFRIALARITLPFFIVFLSVLPSRVYAFVPAAVLIPVLPEVVTSAGAFVELTVIGAMASLVGATISTFSFMDSLKSFEVVVPLSVMDSPVPTVAATATAPSMVCTTQKSRQISGTNPLVVPEFCSDTFLNLCNAALGAITISGGVTFCGTVENGAVIFDSTGYSYLTKYNCPTGYSFTSASGAGIDTCTLSSALAALSAAQDGAYFFNRTASAYTQPAHDADLFGIPVDAATGTLTAPNPVYESLLSNMFITSDGKSIQAYGKDAAGVTHVYQVVKRADNGSDIYVLTPVTLTSGVAGTEYAKLGVSSTGLVESFSSVQTADVLTVANAPNPSPSAVPDSYVAYPYIVPAGQVAPVYDPVTNPFPSPTYATPLSTSTTITPNTGGSTVTFPSDYARQGEAQTAAAPLRDTSIVGDPVEPVAADMPTFGSTFTNLLGWSLPAHASTCPSPTIDLTSWLGTGKTFKIDSHCTIVRNNAALISSSMVVAYTVMALFIVLRA